MANSQINISINAQDNASVAINNTINSLSQMRQNIDMAAHSLQAYTLGIEALKKSTNPFCHSWHWRKCCARELTNQANRAY
ncbi:MAG: hypothetical protein MR964_08170 [Campylobacter sp.]|uniref:hypothetical protein n=1 Tax=Campylobacter sp. TaxID=205 RepID=UPI002AA91E9C|nr:hypothetical protein [Campylobacter sp.]MCI7024174.1 hypothetical protein [Campylobacter sp.]